MTIATDMAALQAQISANEKTQLTAVNTALGTAVEALQAAVANLPSPNGPQGTVYAFVNKTVGNTQALIQECQYLIGTYPADAPPTS